MHHTRYAMHHTLYTIQHTLYTIHPTCVDNIVTTFFFLNSLVTQGGTTWTQGGGHDWQGVSADRPLCGDGQGIYKWTVHVVAGTYHQVGIAQGNWNGKDTDTSNANDKFAYLYSHSTGWNRHRGAAQPVGSPSASSWWSGTWDSHGKGQELEVTLDCNAHTFEVATETQWLGKMSYPSAWSTVYASAGGQSSDHVYRIDGVQSDKCT